MQPATPPPADDPRVQAVPYVPDQVVRLSVDQGFAAVIELSADERVENVVVGDSAAWAVTANKRGDRVVVKPQGRNGSTNMIIVTDQRRYVFLLEPGVGTSPFVLKFIYPPELSGEAIVATVPAATYRFRGAKALFPLTMVDDGRRTTITWDHEVALPAIFAVDRRGDEGLVNGRMKNGDYVIEGVAARYVFRLGKASASATRRPARRGK